jgi:hypothetical protein
MHDLEGPLNMQSLIGLFNILFKAVHIPGIKNTAADHLSRLQIQKFREEFPLMDLLPIVNSVDIQEAGKTISCGKYKSINSL